MLDQLSKLKWKISFSVGCKKKSWTTEEFGNGWPPSFDQQKSATIVKPVKFQ